MQLAFDCLHDAAGADLVHPNQEESQAVKPNGDAGPSSQRTKSPSVTSTTAQAIANFKPSPRDVISGIAPHVFDERRRRRFQKKRATKPYWYGPIGEKRSSPLRGATVISWDETSIYLGARLRSPCRSKLMQSSSLAEQPDTQRTTTVENHETRNPNSTRELEKTDQRLTRRVNSDKSSWKYFRVDKQLLKYVSFFHSIHSLYSNLSIIHNSLSPLGAGVNESFNFQVASREAQVSRFFLCSSESATAWAD